MRQVDLSHFGDKEMTLRDVQGVVLRYRRVKDGTRADHRPLAEESHACIGATFLVLLKRDERVSEQPKYVSVNLSTHFSPYQVHQASERTG